MTQKNTKGVSNDMKKMMVRRTYIGALKACLSARNDFADLKYYRDITTADEYLILSDIVGQVYMLNITGHSEAQIWHALAEIECGMMPNNAITDRAEMLRIAKLMQ